MMKLTYKNRRLLKNLLMLLCFVFVALTCLSQKPSNADSSKTKQPIFICTFNIDSNLNKLYPQLVVPHHRKIPVAALQDSDGDGVPDQLDLEPNTPHGAEVDTHGRALDTDGDGVPDYRDKEKLTPQSCFPVDSNGVGKCPELGVKQESNDDSDWVICCHVPLCNMNTVGLEFEQGSFALDKNAKTILQIDAIQLLNKPWCLVNVIGFCNKNADYEEKLISWKRVDATIRYLVEKAGASENSLVFIYGQEGEANTVELIPTKVNGPN